MFLRSVHCHSCALLFCWGGLSSCGAQAPLPPIAADRADTTASKKKAALPLRVALTFDDLPAHGPTREGQGLVAIHEQIVDALNQHKISGAYGFINGAKLAEHAEGRQVLELWRNAGQPLGNHTWAHSSIDAVGAAAFIEEINKNDTVLAELMGATPEALRARRYFRYPYLRQGKTREMLDEVRRHLAEKSYQIAEVTIDFGDWAYNPAYVRCENAKRSKALAVLRKDYLRRAVQALQWSEAAAQLIYGRSIPHIVLMHSGAFDSLMLDELLTAYEEQGVQWIPVSEAIEDAVYQEDVRVAVSWGGTLLEQRIERDDSEHPPFPIQPIGLLDELCR